MTTIPSRNGPMSACEQLRYIILAVRKTMRGREKITYLGSGNSVGAAQSLQCKWREEGTCMPRTYTRRPDALRRRGYAWLPALAGSNVHLPTLHAYSLPARSAAHPAWPSARQERRMHEQHLPHFGDHQLCKRFEQRNPACQT